MSDSHDLAPALPATEVAPIERASAVSPLAVLVDDDEDILDVLAIIFSEDGFRTMKCRTREAGMAALRAEPADLLVTDLRLGGEDGLELIRFAAGLPAGPPKIILLTAARMAALDAATPLLRGLRVQVVNKPFDIDQLVEVARSLTGWKGLA